MNSFSKDVSKDIERIDMDFRNIKATIDVDIDDYCRSNVRRIKI